MSFGLVADSNVLLAIVARSTALLALIIVEGRLDGAMVSVVVMSKIRKPPSRPADVTLSGYLPSDLHKDLVVFLMAEMPACVKLR